MIKSKQNKNIAKSVKKNKVAAKKTPNPKTKQTKPNSKKSQLSTEDFLAIQNEKILTDSILINPNKTPGLYLIENDKKGEREFFYWRSDSAAKTLFDNIDIRRFSQKLTNCDVIYFSGITLSIYNSKNISC